MIYTKKGDDGTTSLIGGTRVKKYDIRVQTYGEIDHLVSMLGFCSSHLKDNNLISDIITIQYTLFSIESIVACEKEELLSQLSDVRQADVDFLERKIDHMSQVIPPLRSFIIPSQSHTATLFHLATTQTRHCERLLVECNDTYPQPEITLKYMNRLSDYLFTMARYIMFKKNLKEYTFGDLKHKER